MPCPPANKMYHAMPVRLYHVQCYAYQAIPYAMPCLPGHTIYHAITRQVIPKINAITRPAIPYAMSCQPGHIIYHAMPVGPYHMPVRPYHTMPCPPGHTIYHKLSTQVIPGTTLCPPRPYQVPCHALQAIP